MSSVEQAVEPKKKKLPVLILTLVCGLAGIVLGGMQMAKGLREMFGAGEGAQIKQLLTDSDHAIDEANKFNQGNALLFAGLMNDVDNLGLKAFHQQKQEAAREVSEQFGKAAAEFHTAAKKLHEAAQLHTVEKFKTFAASKKRAYESAAEACELNQEIVRLVLDKTYNKLDDVLPKIEAVAARRDAAQKASSEAAAEADAIGKELTHSAES
jgi:hypothetical protein